MRLASGETFEGWLETLETRHSADLTFSQVARSLRALSSTYVGRRGRLREGAALSGAGKRAAFALFYGPLHFLVVRHVASALVPPGGARVSTVLDLGCGTGAAGAAFATVCASPPVIVGIDTHPWALAEAAWTYRTLGFKGTTRRADVAASIDSDRARGRDKGVAKGSTALVAAFSINELTDAARDEVLARLLERAARGDAVLVVEPLARFVAPWWGRWIAAFERAGGRADEWRARLVLPAIVARLDRAAGLDHREITARSLWVPNS